jgi:hypothetical protein
MRRKLFPDMSTQSAKQRVKHTVFILVGSAVALVGFQNCGGFRSVERIASNLSSGVFSGPPGMGDIKDTSVAKVCGTNYKAGHMPLQRLNNDEFNNTVKDLLYVTTATPPAQGFPKVSVGSNGFSNDPETLDSTTEFLYAVYDTSEKLAKAVIATKGQAGGAYSKLFNCGATDTSCAEKSVTQIASRAFRRPLETSGANSELVSFMNVFKAGGGADQGFSDVIVAILNDPRFLYKAIVNPLSNSGGAEFFVSDYELATRLSYFLWQSMPDDELMMLAASNKLSLTENLTAQVTRMLKDQRAKNMARVFRREFANLATFEDTPPVAAIDEQLKADMIQSVGLFFEDIIANNKPWKNVLDADYAFLNSNLIQKSYKGSNLQGSSQFALTPINDPNRIGLVTQPAVLALGGNPDTHPVRRGYWLLSRYLCQTPNPPPPGTPVLDPNSNDPNASPKQRLVNHAKSAACIGCHEQMDELGLGLENFDGLGNWRTNYGGTLNYAVDATGTLPNKAPYASSKEMISWLTSQPQVDACVTKMVFQYAVGRKMASTDDRCVSDEIGKETVTVKQPFAEVVKKLVFSLQFRKQTGEAR